MIKEYSPTLIALLKGILYNSHQDLWEQLLKHEVDIRKYFDDICLELNIDKSEGYAYLKQKNPEDVEIDVPKLIEKRQLNFHVSLLCLLLRKYLIENDSQGQSTRAILSRDGLINMMKAFLKGATNEVKQEEQIKTAIKKVVEEGFLRRLKSEEEIYEVNRIIKAFVNGEVVQETLEKYKNLKKEN